MFVFGYWEHLHGLVWWLLLYLPTSQQRHAKPALVERSIKFSLQDFVSSLKYSRSRRAEVYPLCRIMKVALALPA